MLWPIPRKRDLARPHTDRFWKFVSLTSGWRISAFVVGTGFEADGADEVGAVEDVSHGEGSGFVVIAD